MTRIHALSAFSAKLGAALLLTVAADFLFFDQPVGISMFIFACLMAVAVLVVHPTVAVRRRLAAHAAIATGALLPLLENISGLSLTIAVVGMSIFALSASARLRSTAMQITGQVAGFFLVLPFRLVGDLFRSRTASARMRSAGIRVGTIAVWTMPLALGAVFLLLFGIANPVIEHWISLIDLQALLELLDIWRIAFWLCIAIFVWPFLRPKVPKWLRRSPRTPALIEQPQKSAPKAPALSQTLFSKGAILRALFLFNLMFAVQTILDGAYLWGGIALPDGLSYASYAHRGAYPLIATALLAAAFVLVAMRPGSETSSDRLVRTLVYLWTGQNFVLVISSILRLDLYVSVYSLTYLRVAAFIWMGLVAAGLVLIVARIALGKSNAWLLGANALTLSAVIYACCFINFAAIIAQYNVTHSREMGGEGMSLDVWYLRSLGPAAIPAMDLFLDSPAGTDQPMRRMILAARSHAGERLLGSYRNWRAWTFRDWRLARYLESHPDLPTNSHPLFLRR
jgi:MFS family permease